MLVGRRGRNQCLTMSKNDWPSAGIGAAIRPARRPCWGGTAQDSRRPSPICPPAAHQPPDTLPTTMASCRVAHAFREYRVEAEWEISRWEYNYSRLRDAHKALVPHLPNKVGGLGGGRLKTPLTPPKHPRKCLLARNTKERWLESPPPRCADATLAHMAHVWVVLAP